jgi:cephalosporin hydroxylase
MSAQVSPIDWQPEPKRTLRECAQAHTGRLIDKWSHYFPIYEHHFAKFVGRPINLLEIGVSHGGSLQLWKAYFGSKAKIWGIDIDPRCEEYGEEQIYVLTGDQSDSKFLEHFNSMGNTWDIIIDDGSHIPEDQSTSFRALWPKVKPGGIYLIEDCHNIYPGLIYEDRPLIYKYPWVLVAEKPKRMVMGKPSRPLNQNELDAYGPR